MSVPTVLLAPGRTVTVPVPKSRLIQLRRQLWDGLRGSQRQRALLHLSLLAGRLGLLRLVGEQPLQQVGEADGSVAQIDLWIFARMPQLYIFSPALVPLGADQVPLPGENIEANRFNVEAGIQVELKLEAAREVHVAFQRRLSASA